MLGIQLFIKGRSYMYEMNFYHFFQRLCTAVDHMGSERKLPCARLSYVIKCCIAISENGQSCLMMYFHLKSNAARGRGFGKLQEFLPIGLNGALLSRNLLDSHVKS